MLIKDFIVNALEYKYLGKTIYNWNKSISFVVEVITVEDGGVDPQWEIRFRNKRDNRECFSITLPDQELPEIVEVPDENNDDDPTCGSMLSRCDQCNEVAWDGYICHSCGAKNI